MPCAPLTPRPCPISLRLCCSSLAFSPSQGAFCSETLETLTQPISEEDRRVNKSEWSEAKELMAIAEVKQLILVVQDKEIETDTLIDRCKSMMQYMKKIGRNVGPLVRGR